MARFPDNTRSIEIVGNGTRTQISPPITLNLLNCNELEQLIIQNVGYVTVYANDQAPTQFRFVKRNNDNEEEEDTTVVLHQFPSILGTEEKGYVFDPINRIGYIYDASIHDIEEYPDWRADTLIENPKDHRLYPLIEIASLIPYSEYNTLTIPKTVIDIRYIVCEYITILDLSACTSLSYPSSIAFNEVFVQYDRITKFILPEHWITSGILMELNQLKVSYTNAYLTDQGEPFTYINKESGAHIELINFKNDGTSIEFEPIDIYVLIYPGSIEKLIAEHSTIQNISIPGEYYHFESFKVPSTVAIYVDTQKMKDRLLELNQEANVVIKGEDVVDVVYYDVSTTEQLLPYVTLQDDGTLEFNTIDEKVEISSGVLEEYLQGDPGIRMIYIPGENYSFESFNIRIPVYVDTDTMKNKLLGLNPDAYIVIKGPEPESQTAPD